MSDDLVKMARERANAGGYYSAQWDMLADRIAKLEAELRHLIKYKMVTHDDLERARAVLGETINDQF